MKKVKFKRINVVMAAEFKKGASYCGHGSAIIIDNELYQIDELDKLSNSQVMGIIEALKNCGIIFSLLEKEITKRGLMGMINNEQTSNKVN